MLGTRALPSCMARCWIGGQLQNNNKHRKKNISNTKKTDTTNKKNNKNKHVQKIERTILSQQRTLTERGLEIEVANQ